MKVHQAKPQRRYTPSRAGSRHNALTHSNAAALETTTPVLEWVLRREGAPLTPRGEAPVKAPTTQTTALPSRSTAPTGSRRTPAPPGPPASAPLLAPRQPEGSRPSARDAHPARRRQPPLRTPSRPTDRPTDRPPPHGAPGPPQRSGRAVPGTSPRPQDRGDGSLTTPSDGPGAFPSPPGRRRRRLHRPSSPPAASCSRFLVTGSGEPLRRRSRGRAHTGRAGWDGSGPPPRRGVESLGTGSLPFPRVPQSPRGSDEELHGFSFSSVPSRTPLSPFHTEKKKKVVRCVLRLSHRTPPGVQDRDRVLQTLSQGFRLSHPRRLGHGRTLGTSSKADKSILKHEEDFPVLVKLVNLLTPDGV